MDFTAETYRLLRTKIVKQIQIWEHKKESKSIMAHTMLADRVMKLLIREFPHG